MTTKCNCEHCQLSERTREAILRRDPDELISLLREVMNLNACIGEDLGYYKAVLSGDWPSASRQLEEALEKAKKIEKDRKTE